jgi:hypothetical protein
LQGHYPHKEQHKQNKRTDIHALDRAATVFGAN